MQVLSTRAIISFDGIKVQGNFCENCKGGRGWCQRRNMEGDASVGRFAVLRWNISLARSLARSLAGR